MNLHEIFKKYEGVPGTIIDGIPWDWGGDKGSAHSYIDIYAEMFEPRRNDSLNILEIGVQYGSSMKMWKEYFKNSTIYGLDIKPHCTKYEEERVIIKIMDATNKNDVDKFLSGLFFDVIIDDGSHELTDQLASFNLLYPKLNNGGLYIIEDIYNIDATRDQFINLDKNVYIADVRHIKNKYNDVLVIIQKN